MRTKAVAVGPASLRQRGVAVGRYGKSGYGPPSPRTVKGAEGMGAVALATTVMGPAGTLASRRRCLRHRAHACAT